MESEAPNESSASSRAWMDQLDYHDLPMANLETMAEERLNEAKNALKAGDCTAAQEVERWSITLENIRGLQGAVKRMRAGRHPNQERSVW